jgi:hypothetical protein
MPNPTNIDEASKKRQDQDEKEQTHKTESRNDAHRRRQQNLNQGLNTGTEDVQRISDWGSTRSSKKKPNGKDAIDKDKDDKDRGNQGTTPAADLRLAAERRPQPATRSREN